MTSRSRKKQICPASRNPDVGFVHALDGKIAAAVTLDMIQKQVEGGYAGYLAVLSADQAYQQALINLVQAQTNRYTDTATLFQALGGGW